MQFPPPRRRPTQENLLPMINVVFLLLIFFLIAARMTPPAPFAVTPPSAGATGAEAEGDFTLYIAADGQLGYVDALGDAALPALVAARTAYCAAAVCDTAPPSLTLRADAALPAARLASLLPDLGALGFAGVELVTTGGAE